MSKFYTAVSIIGNNVLCKEISNGKSKIHKIPYQPSFFIPTNDTSSQFKSMDGRPLVEKQFGSIFEAKEFVKRYKDVDNHEFFGNTNYISQFICDAYPDVVDFDLSQLGIWTLDIETTVGEHSEGFPNPFEAAEEMLLITMLNNQTKEYVSWGRKPFSIDDASKLDIDFDITKINLDYRFFSDEAEMLQDFLYWWRNTQIDCLTDWNGDTFDIPYIINRIARVLGGESVNLLSPFKKVSDRVTFINGKDVTVYEIHGIAHIDYLPLYKKFGSYNAKESYRLDFIGQEELGIRKIDMGCTFRESYQDDRYDSFVCYNLRDCEIVDKLEDKMGLIQLIYTIAYDAKCLPNDVFSPVKTWDCMMYRFMLEKNIIISQKKKVRSWAIEGAYVKEPVVGQHEWIVSFDAASLYPTIIMQYNMSPETLVDKPMRSVNVDGLLEKKFDLSDLKENNYGMSANGQMFRNDVAGLFPEIVAKQFGDRKMYKKKMQHAESELELVKAEMKKRGIHD